VPDSSAITLVCDIVVAVVVSTEFGVAEYRHLAARRAAMTEGTPLPPRPRLAWPFVAIAAAALVSTFAYLQNAGTTPSQTGVLLIAIPIALCLGGTVGYYIGRSHTATPAASRDGLPRSTPLLGVCVDFDRLDEFILTFKFTFFNGTGATIAQGRNLFGQMTMVVPKPDPWERLLEPHLQESQSRSLVERYKEIEVVIQQRVTKDQIALIERNLAAHGRLGFYFGGLHIPLQIIDDGHLFRPLMWAGIWCSKKNGKWDFERVEIASTFNEGAADDGS
jgi:hypothetical protein